MKRFLPVLLILALVAWSCTGNGKSESEEGGESMEAQADMDDEAGESMMRKGDMDKDATAYDISGLGPQVVAYAGNEDLMKRTGMRDSTVILYFAAAWCPTCQATYEDLKVHFAQIPSDVTLVFVNYDKEADLKKEFGVTSQHTFVSLDSQGGKKKLWLGSTTLADILKMSKTL